MTHPVGVVGAGNMGGAMVARLRGLGWPVAVHDILPQRLHEAAALGAVACDSAAQVAARCETLIVCVVDADQTRDVLFNPVHGALAGLARDAVVLLCPTIGPGDVEDCARRLAAHGIACVDAPMSGGPARAREGSMSLMVAGPPPTVERLQALLDALSTQVFRLGDRVGDGARTKLVNNLLAAVNLAGAAEALALAERLGLDPGRTLDVIERSSGQSWIGLDRMRRAVAADYAPRAHTTLLAKDTALALQAAREAGMEPALGTLASAVFQRALAEGLGGEDDASLFKLMRR